VSYIPVNSKGNSTLRTASLSRPTHLTNTGNSPVQPFPVGTSPTGEILESRWRGITVNGNSYYDIAFLIDGTSTVRFFRTAYDAVGASIECRNLEGKRAMLRLTASGRVFDIRPV
jgi:hypothetical protein